MQVICGMNSRIVYSPKRAVYPSSAQKMGGRLIFAFSILFLLIAGGIYAVRNEKWQVRNIYVRGTERLDAEQIENDVARMLAGSYFAFVPKNFYAFIDVNRIFNELRLRYPEIQSLRQENSSLDTLNVVIEERSVWGVVCNDLDESEWIHSPTFSRSAIHEKDLKTPLISVAEPRGIQKGGGIQKHDDAVNDTNNSQDSPQKKDVACAYIDSSGYGFENAPRVIGSLIIRVRSDHETLPTSSQIIHPDLMNFMVSLKREIPRVIKEDAVGFEILSRAPSEVRVITSGRFSLWFLRDRDILDALSAFDALLRAEIKEKKSDLEYVDLRFGNKVFYKFESQKR